MRKLVKTSIWVIIICIFVLVAIWWYAMGRIGDVFDKAKEPVGKEIVIKGDTLLIIDYKLLNDSYILEDGKEVAASFVNKQLNDTVDGD